MMIWICQEQRVNISAGYGTAAPEVQAVKTTEARRTRRMQLCPMALRALRVSMVKSAASRRVDPSPRPNALAEYAALFRPTASFTNPPSLRAGAVAVDVVGGAGEARAVAADD